MTIFYLVYNEWTAGQVKILSSFGVKVEQGYKRIDIEAGERYNKLKPYFLKWGVEETYGTTYDKKDIQESSLLVYVATWMNGYPQPEDTQKYLRITYNLDDYCGTCGIGAVQKKSFRLKKEPKWGEKKLFDLEWVDDEIFARKDIYESIFKPLGIESYPVVLHKDESVIENTVQLKIPFIAKNPLKLDDHPFTICEICKRKKYSPKVKGYFSNFEKKIPPELQIFKCKEFLGAEFSAHNKIFITAELLNKLNSLKVKPNVWPVR